MNKFSFEEGIPGSEFLNKGLSDLKASVLSEESLLVLIGRDSFQRAGYDVPELIIDAFPEHKLYNLLGQRLGNGAHSAYNALIRRLVSAERIVKQLS